MRTPPGAARAALVSITLVSVRRVLGAGAAATLCLSVGATAAYAAPRASKACHAVAGKRVCAATATAATSRAVRRKVRLKASGGPIDYTALPGLSQPTATGVERTAHELLVGDGTRLHLEIVKPAGAENLGVILEASPYHGTLYDRTGARIIPTPGTDGKPIGLSGFFPKRGYAVVFMDSAAPACPRAA